jgi:hypothetical protein
MFVNYFRQQCLIGVHDAIGHLAGLLCIKFREDILIINAARPVLLEFAELADSAIYPPSSILYYIVVLILFPFEAPRTHGFFIPKHATHCFYGCSSDLIAATGTRLWFFNNQLIKYQRNVDGI